VAEREKRGSRARERAARRKRRRGRIGRILPIAVLVVVAYFYYRPLSSWVQARSALGQRQKQVAALEQQKAQLEQAVTRATTLASLARRARRIGLVQEGEQLFIVKGIPAWRRAHRDMTAIAGR
jgi:cell division protein FtsB